MTPPRRVAVIGSGVAGLTAAYVASRTAEVTLFEADERLGGHADTHQVGHLAIDTGFIVHNERTYPVLLRLFSELGVPTQPSEMSLSVHDEETGLEYAGALGPRGLFPTMATLTRPGYLRMLVEIPRFHRQARRLLAPPSGAGEGDQTLRAFLAEGGFSAYFQRHFMAPLVAAVWSCDPAVALDYPARYLFTFLDHHGMLGIFGSPTWRTVVGGSRTYVAKVAEAVHDVRPGTKVVDVVETASGVRITDGNGETHDFDAAVIATHPDQALAMLAEPTAAQAEVLAALTYSDNMAQLHTDTSLLPDSPRARASWNFRRRADAGAHPGQVTVTYDLTRLMRLPTDTHYLVTLGGTDLVDPDRVVATRHYAHPLYTPASVAAQARLPECDTDRLAFAGAYHGWGFHEDGARSGLAAVERLGLRWPSAPATRPVLATGLVRTTIRHTRRRPMTRAFEHRSHTWLVDLDDLPDHGVLARFEARDHLGDPDRSLRDNVDAFLRAHGVDLPSAAEGGRVLMAAQARAFGFCFNPISVFWCFDARRGPEPVCAVVEVHNTYGDRHAYLVHPDAQGRARTDKAMYVSPFHGTDGHYEIAVPVPVADSPMGASGSGGRLRVAVTLHSDRGAVFSASLTGDLVTGDPSRGQLLRQAPASLRDRLLINAHGIWLWARRLPIRPRPIHPRQEGVQ